MLFLGFAKCRVFSKWFLINIPRFLSPKNTFVGFKHVETFQKRRPKPMHYQECKRAYPNQRSTVVSQVSSRRASLTSELKHRKSTSRVNRHDIAQNRLHELKWIDWIFWLYWDRTVESWQEIIGWRERGGIGKGPCDGNRTQVAVHTVMLHVDALTTRLLAPTSSVYSKCRLVCRFKFELVIAGWILIGCQYLYLSSVRKK